MDTNDHNEDIVTYCAWCKRKLCNKDHNEQSKISHGICNECQSKFEQDSKMAKVKEIKMKITASKNGKRKITLSRTDWEKIGKKAGWKVAQFGTGDSYEPELPEFDDAPKTDTSVAVEESDGTEYKQKGRKSGVKNESEEDLYPLPENLRSQTPKEQMSKEEAKLERWTRKIYYLPVEIGACPPEIRDNEKIKTAVHDGWVRFLTLSPGYYNDSAFPKEFKDLEEMKAARKEGWIKELITYPKVYDNLIFDTKNADLKKDPEIQSARITGWVNKIDTAEDKRHAAKYLPPDLYNNPDIVKAMGDSALDEKDEEPGNPYDKY